MTPSRLSKPFKPAKVGNATLCRADLCHEILGTPWEWGPGVPRII